MAFVIISIYFHEIRFHVYILLQIFIEICAANTSLAYLPI